MTDFDLVSALEYHLRVVRDWTIWCPDATHAFVVSRSHDDVDPRVLGRGATVREAIQDASASSAAALAAGA